MPLYTGTQGVQVIVYKDTDATALQTPLEILDVRLAPQAMEELRANGAGSVQIPKYDDKIIADPTLLDYRNVLKLRVDGVIQGAFIIQTKKLTIVGEGEKAQEVWEVSGEGLRTWGNDAVVYSETGISASTGDNRNFNFGSVTRSSWYVDAEWVNATVVYQYLQSGNFWGTAPANWPDAPLANWIWDRGNSSWAMPQGYVYFRKEFTVTTAASYAFFYGVDDSADVYVDGELKVTTSDHAFQEVNRLDVDLAVGNHVIAIKAYNYKSDGPGALIGALFTYGDASQPTSATLVFVTDSTWKVRAYPSIEPGWTAGDVLLRLLSEAATRGVRFATNLSATFTATLDSGGYTWDRMPYSFTVGAKYNEVFQAIEELGADIAIDPNTMQINAYKKRGYDKGLSRTDGGIPVILRPAQNILTAAETGQADIVNTVLLHTGDGWSTQTTTDGTSLTKYGVIEGQYTTDLGLTTAQPLVTELFRVKSQAERSETITFIPVQDMVPNVDFKVGDYVSVPNSLGVYELRRVMSISVTENATTGMPTYACEFDAIFRDRLDRLEAWLTRSSGGSLSGASANGASLPDSVATTPPSSGVLGSVPDAPTGLSVTSTGRWQTDGSATSEFKLTWNPVISGTGFGVVTITGYEVWGKRNDQSEFLLLMETANTAGLLTGYRPTEQWTFRVRAVSRTGGPGPFSSDVNQTAAQPPASVGTPSAPTLSTGLGSVTVKWDGLLGGVAAAGYINYVRVERRLSPSGSWAAIGVITRVSMVDSAVVTGTAYDYRLVAVDALGNESTASATATITATGVSAGDVTGSLPINNLIYNPSFEDGLNGWEIVQQATTGSPSATSVTGGVIGSSVLRMIRGSETTLADQILEQTVARGIPVAGGNTDGYFLSARVYASAAVTAGFSMRAYWFQGDKTTPSTTPWTSPFAAKNLTTTSQLFVGQVYPPSDARYMRVALIQGQMSSTIYVDDVNATAVITQGQLGNNVVQAAQISAGAVTANALAAGSITTPALAAGAITADKIAVGSITADRIAAGAGNALDISSNSSINLIVNRQNTTDANVSTNATNVANLQTYYNFGVDGAVIGKTDSPFKLLLKNDQIQITQNGAVVSYWTSGQMVVPSFIGQSVVLANHKIEKYGTGTVVKAL